MGWDSEDLQEVAGGVLQDAPRLGTTLHGYYIANRFTPRFVLCMVAPEITSTLGRQAAGPNHNHKYILGTHMAKGGGGRIGDSVPWGGVCLLCVFIYSLDIHNYIVWCRFKGKFNLITELI